MYDMKKKVGILLIISLIFLVQINGAIICMGYKYRDEYIDASQKIFTRIDSFSFVFDSQSIQYAVYFGGMFETYNDTHKRFVSDVFVVTLNEYYVTSLPATLDFDVIFTATGINIMHSAVRGDTSSIMQSHDVIYEFEIHDFLVPKDLFPVTLTVDFDYELSSSEFFRSDSYMGTKTFEWSTPMDIMLIVGIVVGVVAVIAITTIAIVVYRRRRRPKLVQPIIPTPTETPAVTPTSIVQPAPIATGATVIGNCQNCGNDRLEGQKFCTNCSQKF